MNTNNKIYEQRIKNLIIDKLINSFLFENTGNKSANNGPGDLFTEQPKNDYTNDIEITFSSTRDIQVLEIPKLTEGQKGKIEYFKKYINDYILNFIKYIDALKQGDDLQPIGLFYPDYKLTINKIINRIFVNGKINTSDSIINGMGLSGDELKLYDDYINNKLIDADYLKLISLLKELFNFFIHSGETIAAGSSYSKDLFIEDEDEEVRKIIIIINNNIDDNAIIEFLKKENKNKNLNFNFNGTIDLNVEQSNQLKEALIHYFTKIKENADAKKNKTEEPPISIGSLFGAVKEKIDGKSGDLDKILIPNTSNFNNSIIVNSDGNFKLNTFYSIVHNEFSKIKFNNNEAKNFMPTIYTKTHVDNFYNDLFDNINLSSNDKELFMGNSLYEQIKIIRLNKILFENRLSYLLLYEATSSSTNDIEKISTFLINHFILNDKFKTSNKTKYLLFLAQGASPPPLEAIDKKIFDFISKKDINNNLNDVINNPADSLNNYLSVIYNKFILNEESKKDITQTLGIENESLDKIKDHLKENLFKFTFQAKSIKVDDALLSLIKNPDIEKLSTNIKNTVSRYITIRDTIL